MKYIIIIVILLLDISSSLGQIAVLPNVSFSDNNERETIVQGERNRIIIKYRISPGVTEEYVKKNLKIL